MTTRPHPRRTLRSCTVAAAVGVLALSGGYASAAAPAAISSAASTAPYCGIVWGSLEKSSSPMSTGMIDAVRAGRHDCFDRMVVDVRGPVPGHDVGYVSPLLADGSGQPVAVRGGAVLQVVVRAHTENVNTGAQVYRPANPAELVNLSGYSTFRQVKLVGPSFEGITQIGLGVRARLPFRVFTLSGPGDLNRVVIDVAHRW